jgi:hypothetical protein
MVSRALQDVLGWIQLVQWRVLVNMVTYLQVPENTKCIYQLRNISVSRRTLLQLRNVIKI